MDSRDAYAGGQEGQELSFVLNSFHLSYLLKRHFSALYTVWFKEIFLGASPPDPQIVVVLLGDQFIKHCSSGKEFEDRNLSLWRNTYSIWIDLPSLEALPPCPRYAQASLMDRDTNNVSLIRYVNRLSIPTGRGGQSLKRDCRTGRGTQKICDHTHNPAIPTK